MPEKNLDMAAETVKNEVQLQKLFHHLAELCRNDFYGKVELAIEKGNIVLVRKTQTIKL